MKQTIVVLNELERAGYFRRYAIGGAVAAIYYVTPFETEDLDILILLPAELEKSLSPLAPLYEELRNRGYHEDGPYVIVEGMPVQFLPAYNPLVEEAVEHAINRTYEEVPTWLPGPEHLAAIMLQTGRRKDRARFEQMREEASLDNDSLLDIIERHQLMERYRQWTAE